MLTASPWADLARWTAAPNRLSAVAVIHEQERQRIPWLLPLRHQRMREGVYAFFRGSAALMARDLGQSRHSGQIVQLCGDAHLLNFGFYASPERSLLFDIVDFDETYPGPFEWDLKRLVTSLVLVLQDRKRSHQECEDAARHVAGRYRETIGTLAELPLLEMWGSRVNLERALERSESSRFRKHLNHVIEGSRERDTLHAAERLCTRDSTGGLIFQHEPPELLRFESLPNELRGELNTDQWSEAMMSSYAQHTPSHIQQLLSYFQWSDWALKAVGVASVGTRCSISLWIGPHENDVLILQCKQALPSVLQPDPHHSSWMHQGQRVVEGQRLMQTHSDPFLGWATNPLGDDLIWRHFRDWKGSIELKELGLRGLVEYCCLCAWVLAKAHARSSKATPIARWINNNEHFDQAIADFAISYSQTVHSDYREFCEALGDDDLLQ